MNTPGRDPGQVLRHKTVGSLSLRAKSQPAPRLLDFPMVGKTEHQGHHIHGRYDKIVLANGPGECKTVPIQQHARKSAIMRSDICTH